MKLQEKQLANLSKKATFRGKKLQKECCNDERLQQSENDTPSSTAPVARRVVTAFKAELPIKQLFDNAKTC